MAKSLCLFVWWVDVEGGVIDVAWGLNVGKFVDVVSHMVDMLPILFFTLVVVVPRATMLQEERS